MRDQVGDPGGLDRTLTHALGRGAQAILTPRGWDQSDRFDEAWALLAAEHHVEIHVLANVIPSRHPSRAARRAQDEN